MSQNGETARRFDCFGSSVGIYAASRDRDRDERAVKEGSRRLLDIHARLSRFLPDSELSTLNQDPRRQVPATHLMLCFARAVRSAGMLSDGLVDATCLQALLDAGYSRSLEPAEGPTLQKLLGPDRRHVPATPDPAENWRAVTVDERTSTVSRPPGVLIDSGGIAKGLAADLVGADLRGCSTWAVDCGGDILIGGCAGLPRNVDVDDPFGGPPLRTFEITGGAIATSGIGRRTWRRADGSRAHHLIDPGSGLPADTGIVQATALGRTCFEAEVLAKTALLSGPERGPAVLIHGGLIVLDDGTTELARAERSRIAA